MSQNSRADSDDASATNVASGIRTSRPRYASVMPSRDRSRATPNACASRSGRRCLPSRRSRPVRGSKRRHATSRRSGRRCRRRRSASSAPRPSRRSSSIVNSSTFGQLAGRRGRVARAVVVLGDDRLALVGVEELEVGLGHLARCRASSTTLVDDRDRRLGEDAARRRARSRTCPAPELVQQRGTPRSPRSSSTSPMPRWANVVVAPRAPESSTGTLRYSLRDEVLRRRRRRRASASA